MATRKIPTPKKTSTRALHKELRLALRFLSDSIRGFFKFYRLHPCITVYGSARIKEGNPHYQLAFELGKGLAKEGFTIMTGAGPGIMEAANRGAKTVMNSLSVGCAIKLPFEKNKNDYLDKTMRLSHFFSRKLMLCKHSVGFVALPGGFGTLDELFEISVLIQTQHVKAYPIVLMGRNFWSPLLRYLKETLVAEQTISASDIDRLFFLTDSVDEAICHIKAKLGDHDD